MKQVNIGISIVAALPFVILLNQCGSSVVEAPVRPSLEDKSDDGGPFTPSTQSFLRGDHWMEHIQSISIFGKRADKARVVFTASESNPEKDDTLELRNYPLTYIVPRLHYAVKGEPDSFDAFNLMLAEFSRNSVSVPVGKKGDTMAHFQTSLPEAPPWSTEGDYQFVPNPYARPVRVGLINNCLKAGLWEISATDRSGEIYHAWFDMPSAYYYGLVAEVNGVSPDFAEQALKWRNEKVALVLERLRAPIKEFGVTPVSLHREDLARGFSSQDSRRKIAKGFARVSGSEGWRSPETLSELTEKTCRLTEFVEPGKYKRDSYREFDLRFLGQVRSAKVMAVTPRTSYDPSGKPSSGMDYVEIQIFLDPYVLIIGNLPLQLIVPQEDYVLNGFGVGVLSSGGIAERRGLLISEGPAPSFAYLALPGEHGYMGVNSHDFGLEQIFIRTHFSETPWWEITVTSYERIVDLIKYKVEIPEPLRDQVKNNALRYISPTYFTYRDDNLR